MLIVCRLRSEVPRVLTSLKPADPLPFASTQLENMVLKVPDMLSGQNCNISPQALHLGPAGRPAVCIFGAGAVGQYLAVALEPHCRSLTLCCSASTYSTIKNAGVMLPLLHELCFLRFRADDVTLFHLWSQRRVSSDRVFDRG